MGLVRDEDVEAVARLDDVQAELELQRLSEHLALRNI